MWLFILAALLFIAFLVWIAIKASRSARYGTSDYSSLNLFSNSSSWTSSSSSSSSYDSGSSSSDSGSGFGGGDSGGGGASSDF